MWPLAGGMLFTFLAVPPTGNFLLNDDWIYATMVCDLLGSQGWEAIR